MGFSLKASRVRGILLDIEGTTTSIRFVYETLFPYARQHVRSFLERHAGEVRQALEELRQEHARDQNPPPWSGKPEDLNGLVAYVEWLMNRDRKSTGLKALQGKIWESGYRDGALHGEVFPDVPKAFERWTRLGMRVFIFSSGSVLAQKLIFQHTPFGDLTRYLSGFFDTTTGSKTSSGSYASIASAIRLAPEDLLFISDVEAELQAAHEAGLQALLSVRPGNKPVEKSRFQVIRSFEEIVE